MTMQSPKDPPRRELPDPIPEILKNKAPIPNIKSTPAENEAYNNIFKKLQGNILKGHGRDFSANIFVQFTCPKPQILKWLKKEGGGVTTAAIQFEESEQFKRFGIPGALFKGIYLAGSLYNHLNLPNTHAAFSERGTGLASVFHRGMKKTSGWVFDDFNEIQKRRALGKTSPLEDAHLDGTIHAMVLLADDDETFLHRKTREFINDFEKASKSQPAAGKVVSVELGKALRNQDGEGIEHFGYVDGRSQPLFLATDFKGLTINDAGEIDTANTTEKINEKAQRKESGDITIWNPFAPLSLVLHKDKLANDELAFGSYFVFRKLEQDVMRFSMQEQILADKLTLEGSDRERAGAMAVGRFRDGTPLTQSQADGMIPAKANNFRYDGLDAKLESASTGDDLDGSKCPYHAHIRKTNPRQAKDAASSPIESAREGGDRGHRIVRRGIPYGDRTKAPNAFQALEDLPSSGVGLLFGCFQADLNDGFMFIQQSWANSERFRRPDTGIDPLIGQRTKINPPPPTPQTWRKTYGPSPTPIPEDNVKLEFSDFIKFRGGEFFFAPSLAFFLNL